MSLNRSTVKSIAMVFMIVSSSLLAPVGGAAAQVPAASSGPEAGECSNLDDFVMFLSLGAVNSDTCSRQAYADAAISDMKESDTAQTKVDVYDAAAGLEAGQTAWNAPMDNYLNDTQSVAWMKVEVAVAEAYESGKSKSQAEIAARQAISNYYAVKQRNLIEQWNVTATQTNVLSRQASMEDGMSGLSDGVPEDGFVYLDEGSGNGGDSSYNGLTNTSMTLVNGNSTGVVGMSFSNSDAPSQTLTPENPAYVNNWASYNPHFGVAAPNSNYDDLRFFHMDDYQDRWDRIVSLNDQLQSEATNFVDGTWSEYDSGNINSSDVISSNTAMFEYGTRSANESEGLWRSTAALAMGGYDTPDLNNSGMMTVEYRNSDHTGLLMAKNAPNGTWEVNTTYNTSNIDGPVFMTKTDGTKLDFADGEEFTIVGMTAKDGTAVNSTQTTKYRYKTANTTELLEVQNQLLELRQEIEEREPDAGGSFDLGSTDTMLVGLLALAGALLMMQNQNRGGQR